MAKKLCEICGASPATVPDRNRPGRSHQPRMWSMPRPSARRGYVREIMRLHEQRRQRTSAREGEQ